MHASGLGLGRFEWARRAHRLVADRLRPNKVEIDGHVLVLDQHDSLDLATLGDHEPYVSRYLEETIRFGDIVIDGGAHIGLHALRVARLVGPTGKVIAVEPDPDNARLLTENLARYGYTNVEVQVCALGDHTGTALLYRSPERTSDHRLMQPRTEPARAALPVRVVTLDDLCRYLPAPVRLVKLDIQGSEPAAVRGMTALLKRSPSMELITEYWPEGLAEADMQPHAFLESLVDTRWTLLSLDHAFGYLRPVTPAFVSARCPAPKLPYVNLLGRRSAHPR